MVECVLDQIVQCFGDPNRITEDGECFIGKFDCDVLFFPGCADRKALTGFQNELPDRSYAAFQDIRIRIELCNLQKILNEKFHPLKLLRRKCLKMLTRFGIKRFVRQQFLINGQ